MSSKFDRIQQTDSHENTKDGVIETITNSDGSKSLVNYEHHFIDRANERNMGKNNLPVTQNSVRSHIRKAHKWIKDNKVRDGKFCFIHKPTGHKTVTYVEHGKIRHSTYLDHTQKVDDFEHPKQRGQRAGKVVFLEKVAEKISQMLEQKAIIVELD